MSRRRKGLININRIRSYGATQARFVNAFFSLVNIIVRSWLGLPLIKGRISLYDNYTMKIDSLISAVKQIAT